MIIPLLKGLATTLRMVFTKPITQQYPEEKREMFPRWRGHPQLTIDPDGRRRCVACTLCMVVCPSQRHPGHRGRRKATNHEKYPVQFTIDLQRCIFCGFCQEACPKGAIKLNNALRTGPGRQKRPDSRHRDRHPAQVATAAEGLALMEA